MPAKVGIDVGRRIRELRIAAGLSQTQLAGELGVTFQQVQKYEKGQNRVGAGRLTKIARVLNVPVIKLLGVDKERAGKHKATAAASPLGLLTPLGAVRLLRAYATVEDRTVRRLIVAMVESIAHRPVDKSSRN